MIQLPQPIIAAWVKRVARSKHTEDNYLRVIRGFEAFCCGKSVTPETIRDITIAYIDSKIKKDARGYVINGRSINLIATAIRSFFKEIIARGLLKTCPLEGYKQHPVKRFSNKVSLPEQEMYALLSRLLEKSNTLKDARDFVIVYFLYMYALRVSSLVSLQYPTNGVLLIWQKGNRVREEKLTSDAAKTLEFWRSFNPVGKYVLCRVDPYGKGLPGPLTTRSIMRIVKEIDPRLTTHSFRKSFAEHQITNGLEPWSIANAMGCQVRQVDYYSHDPKSCVDDLKGVWDENS